MRSSADDMRMTYVPVDDLRMTYPPADDVLDDVPTCRRCADNILDDIPDDMRMTVGVVLHEIGQLRQEEAAILNSST